MKIGKLFNIPVFVHWSFLILALFVIGSPGGFLALGIITFSILLHEFAHALVAKHFRARVSGVILLGFGGAAYIEDHNPTPGKMMIISAAGPIANLSVGILFAPLLLVNPLLAFAKPFVYLNLLMGLLNLLPCFPLDGGRILNGYLKTRFNDLKSTKLTMIIGVAIALIITPISLVFGLPFLGFILLLFVPLASWKEYKNVNKSYLGSVL